MSTSDKNSPAVPTRPRVFISYRRRFDQGFAHLLKRDLTSAFGGEAAFRDVDDIPPGEDFKRSIIEAVESCDVFLALISPGWLETVESLRNPDDFVRLEIATALGKGARVIPVLLNGAQMPSKDSLPAELVGLTSRQAEELRDGRWDDDVRHLITAVRRFFGERQPPEPTIRGESSGAGARPVLRGWWPWAALVALSLAAGFAFWRYAATPPIIPLADGNTNAASATPTLTPTLTPTPVYRLTPTPTPAATSAAVPTPTPAQDVSSASPERCFKQLLPERRWVELEYGDVEFRDIIRRQLPQQLPVGILLKDGGVAVGAVRLRFLSSGGGDKPSGFLRVDAVYGPDCRPTGDYGNADRPGVKDTLNDYEYLRMTLGGKTYDLRVTYTEHDTIRALFAPKRN